METRSLPLSVLTSSFNLGPLPRSALGQQPSLKLQSFDLFMQVAAGAKLASHKSLCQQGNINHVIRVQIKQLIAQPTGMAQRCEGGADRIVLCLKIRRDPDGS
jgi:hypothetical protein